MSFFSKIINKSGQRVNPATDETLTSIKAKTDLLSVDTGSNFTPGNLKVRVASSIIIPVSNTATSNQFLADQTTLAAIKSQTDLLTFDNTSSLQTTGISPTLDPTGVNVKDTTTANINPVTEEKVLLWRRMHALMQSQAVASDYVSYVGGIDFMPRNCQRVTIDGFGDTSSSTIYGLDVSGPNVPIVTLSTDSLPFVSTGLSYVGWNDNKFKDPARTTFARNIRKNLIFSKI